MDVDGEKPNFYWKKKSPYQKVFTSIKDSNKKNLKGKALGGKPSNNH